MLSYDTLELVLTCGSETDNLLVVQLSPLLSEPFTDNL